MWISIPRSMRQHPAQPSFLRSTIKGHQVEGWSDRLRCNWKRPWRSNGCSPIVGGGEAGGPGRKGAGRPAASRHGRCAPHAHACDTGRACGEGGRVRRAIRACDQAQRCCSRQYVILRISEPALFWYICFWFIWNLEIVSGFMAIELVRFRILTLNVDAVREFLLPQPKLEKKLCNDAIGICYL